ncbi:MAG: acyl-CoA desaturase [Acidobacteria bacterium]|nr:acyl-CoA desaturase [Acidobacteriota bacterium]
MATAARSLSIPLPNGARISVVGVTPFALMHLLALGVFFVPFKWSYAITCVALVFGRMFWVTAGYHRYFSHRSFKTSRFFQFVIAFMAMTSAQKGVLWWAAHHRHHHRFSDQEEDLHSPTLFGFFWSHIGWIVSDRYNDTRTNYIADFAKFRELRWLNKYHWVPPATLGVSLYLIGGLPLFLWGFVLSTVLLWHDTFTINSLSHLFGTVRYKTTDTSKNNWFLALLTLGEGWHNNHHHFMASARQGFFWWEIDITYYTLKLLAALGLVWELRQVPAHLLHSEEEEVELAA